MEKQVWINLALVRTNQRHSPPKATTKIPVYDGVPIERRFVGEHDVAGTWHYPSGPLREVLFCDVPNLSEVQFATLSHVLYAKVDRPGCGRLRSGVRPVEQFLV